VTSFTVTVSSYIKESNTVLKMGLRESNTVLILDGPSTVAVLFLNFIDLDSLVPIKSSAIGQ